MPSPGEILGGRYRLDDRIAAGGMGEVWRATDTVLGRDVAVKTLHADRAVDPDFQERFRREARSMAALHHPGIADVYDFGETGGGTDSYIVMARVEGEPLNKRIAERGRLTAAETMSVVAQAGRALEAAHLAGIVHRDVKPGNLIIRPDGTVVLVDFGVARTADSVTLTGVGEVVGTALYIAPEQVSKEPIGPAVDVYALGVVAYHCLAGQPPFTGDNPVAIALQHLNEPPPELPADVPPAVRAVVTTAMAKAPQDRFRSASAMAEAADDAVAGFPGGETTALLAAPAAVTAAVPPSVPPAPTLAENRTRRRAWIAATATAFVLAGAGTALALNLADDGTPVAPAPSTSAPGSASTGDAPPPDDGGAAPTRTRTATTRPAPPAGTPSASPSSATSEPTSAPPVDPPPVTDEPPTTPGPGPSTGGGGDENEPDENEPPENEGGGGA